MCAKGIYLYGLSFGGRGVVHRWGRLVVVQDEMDVFQVWSRDIMVLVNLIARQQSLWHWFSILYYLATMLRSSNFLPYLCNPVLVFTSRANGSC